MRIWMLKSLSGALDPAGSRTWSHGLKGIGRGGSGTAAPKSLQHLSPEQRRVCSSAEPPESSRIPSSMEDLGNSAAATAGKRLQGMLKVSSANSGSDPLTGDLQTFAWWGARLWGVTGRGKLKSFICTCQTLENKDLTASKSKVKIGGNSELFASKNVQLLKVEYLIMGEALDSKWCLSNVKLNCKKFKFHVSLS